MRRVVPAGARLVPEQATQVFKGVIYDVYQWQQPMFDGSRKTYEMLKRPDTVKVIAIQDGQIVAIKDEQPGLPPKLTLPGGRNDVPTEDELAAAKRELHEETGLRFAHWKLIWVEQHQNKVESFVYTFLATDLLDQDAPTLDKGGEKISVTLMSFADAKKMAETRTDHYWPNDILRRVRSLDELTSLPEVV
jgi:ADP-ribose pyrophosphatase